MAELTVRFVDGRDRKTDAMRAESGEFGQPVARIRQQLAPDVEMRRDVELEGRATGRERQVDIPVTRQVGRHESRIVIACKDYAAFAAVPDTAP